MPRTVHVELWSDVQCVWCYIGDARWREALALFPGPVKITHRSFELQPGAPVEFDQREYLSETRGLSAAAQERAFDSVRQVAAAAGLAYEPERIRPTNSHLALELLHFASSEGRHHSMQERLFAAYFAEGQHIGSIDSLAKLAAEAGLDADLAREALKRGRFSAAVDSDIADAAGLDVSGVPFAAVDGRFAVAGALEVKQLLEVLNRAVM